mgnify:CR=1 FL=1
MKTITFLATLFLALGLLSANSASQIQVKMGYMAAAIAGGPTYIAMEKGYFKELGIEVKLVGGFASAAQMMAPLSTGEIQVAPGGFTAGLFNALARGMPIKIALPANRAMPGLTQDAIMIRADLKDKIKKIADLKGRKVAVNAKGSPLEYMLGKMLGSEGLSIKDVEIVYMPWPDMGPAFARGAIDAGGLVDPLATQFQERGHAIIWKRTPDFIKDPYMEVAAIFFNKDWAEKNPEVARGFALAYIRGAREYMEAARGGKNRNDVVDIIRKYTVVKDRALYDKIQWAYIDPDGKILKESIKDLQDWFIRHGMVPQRADIDAYVDEGYARYALEKLGPYRP